MPDLTFYDAAYPPAHPPVTDGVCMYIGGDTPHVWTKEEIDAQHARYRLPIFVRSNPPGPGATADVAAAVEQLRAIGAPKDTLVCWDMETAVDAAYISQVHGDLGAAGYTLIVYGSESTVRGNENPNGLYFGADWTGHAHIAAGDAMTQYVSGPDFDCSLAQGGLPFWDTKPAPPPHPTDWTEKILQELPTVKENDTGRYVRTVQGLCGARGHEIKVDGDFGPMTRSAVQAVQASAQIGVDGIVGPHTWPVLIGV